MADETKETDDDTQKGSTQTGETTGKQSQEKTLTQADVDRIVQERIARERAKFADYDELKAKAEASMSDQEKAIAEAADKARKEALSEVGTARLEDRIQVAAAKLLNDPADAVRLLDRDGLDPYDSKVDDEITARVKKLVEAKPYLAVKAPSAGGGDAGSRGGGGTTAGISMNDRIRQAAGRA